MLAVMFGAWMGLRRLEMAQINIATDIEDNPEEMRLLVHGKGIKERGAAYAGRTRPSDTPARRRLDLPRTLRRPRLRGLRRHPHQGGHIVPQPQPAA